MPSHGFSPPELMTISPHFLWRRLPLPTSSIRLHTGLPSGNWSKPSCWQPRFCSGQPINSGRTYARRRSLTTSPSLSSCLTYSWSSSAGLRPHRTSPLPRPTWLQTTRLAHRMVLRDHEDYAPGGEARNRNFSCWPSCWRPPSRSFWASLVLLVFEVNALAFHFRIYRSVAAWDE